MNQPDQPTNYKGPIDQTPEEFRNNYQLSRKAVYAVMVGGLLFMAATCALVGYLIGGA